MIGCDIVDLEYTRQHSNWKRRGFLQKIFTGEEQFLIHNSLDPFLIVWRLWSMKETAYKANAHQSKSRLFNPTKLVCTLHNDERGIVQIDNHIYPTSTKYSDTYIFTRSDIPNVQNNIFRLPNPPTTSYHNAIIEQIAQDKNWDPTNLKILKSTQGFPFVSYKGLRQDIFISISHHGKYGGWSLLQ